MRIWEEIASAAPTEEESFRWASLRWFLRFYQSHRPGVVYELVSRALPAFKDSLFSGGNKDKQQALRTAVENWIDDFGLPRSSEMEMEVVLTLLFSLSSSGQPAFAWDRIQGILETNRSSLPYSSFPFTFQAVGWTPADESIEEAIRRLRRDFGKTLSEHRAFWDMQQKLATILDALPERNKDHFRNIRWLAQKQACPDISLADLVGKKGVPSIQTVRRGIHAVAEFLGIPQEKIHRARSGRKPAGPR